MRQTPPGRRGERGQRDRRAVRLPHEQLPALQPPHHPVDDVALAHARLFAERLVPAHQQREVARLREPAPARHVGHVERAEPEEPLGDDPRRGAEQARGLAGHLQRAHEHGQPAVERLHQRRDGLDGDGEQAGGMRRRVEDRPAHLAVDRPPAEHGVPHGRAGPQVGQDGQWHGVAHRVAEQERLGDRGVLLSR
ncbi:hypothetical protein GCM10020220_082170 [Nonomuraea rubra]